MSEVFYGYCFDNEGKYTPAVTLKGAEQVYSYIMLHKGFYPELRITDSDDSLVVQAKNGRIVYPPEWAIAFNG